MISINEAYEIICGINDETMTIKEKLFNEMFGLIDVDKKEAILYYADNDEMFARDFKKWRGY